MQDKYHPAEVGHRLKVYQNNGWRDGEVVKVTPKRVRIQWQQRNGKTTGSWFLNIEGMIGLNCRDINGAQISEPFGDNRED